jgi:hypothetical protein
MDIRYNINDMLRDPDGIIRILDIEMYLHDGDPLLNKQLRIELGTPTGSPIPFESVTEASIQEWLMAEANQEGTDRLVEASQAIQAESQLTSGLPWGV